MNTDTELQLPQGTAVYCCPQGLVLNLSWQSRLGTHIVRAELPFDLCRPGRLHDLRKAAEGFRRLAANEGFRG